MDGGTKSWKGVPYAAPPVGDLRWWPPVPAESWSGARDATEFADVCIQQSSETDFLGSEDCLYLNVFAPRRSSPSSGLPVMVHLHPGSNSGFHPYTNADAFVRRDVLVVTVGYRLGVFGWVGHPALTAEGGGSSGEYGILDQIAALEWVQRNIAAFGGDPTNVTLFGESAGSFDATAIVLSPIAQGLVHRAALQTESRGAWYQPRTIADAEQLGLDVADVVGCSGTPDVASCMRGLDAESLVVALGFFDVAPWVGGVVLPRSPAELAREQGPTIPLLIGSDREEAALIFFGSFIAGDDEYTDFFWQLDTEEIAGAARAAEVRALYPTDAYDSLLWAAVDMFTDVIYTCPMRELGLGADGPVWRYLYTHVYENDEFLASWRATHFLEDPVLWHDRELLAGFGAADYVPTAGELGLSAAMTTYWTNFAKSGDPNGAGVPAWPAYEPDTERIVVLDDPISETAGYHAAQCDFWATVPEIFPEG